MHYSNTIIRAAFLFCAGGPIGLHTAQAQTAANTAGIKGGLNWTNLLAGGEDVNDEDSRLGFHVGVFGRVSPGDVLGIQAELLYTTKGTTVVYDGLIDQEISFNLGYAELPLFAAIRLGEVLELHAGGYAAYLLSSNVDTDGDLGSGSEDLDRDNFNGMDYGLLGGVGVNLGAVQLGARYTYGLAKLAKSDAAELLLGDARNAGAQVYLAFGLGSKD